VGKSTIATQLAARLGIVRFVATDAIREVMRSMFSPELMPTLHTSSFEADAALREPPTRSADPLIVGFREQTAAVAVGINALIERAALEGTSIIIEGARPSPEERLILIWPVVLTCTSIDVLLVEKGLAPSRAKAQALVMAGLVTTRTVSPTSVACRRT
jgi:hypothetical protein